MKSIDILSNCKVLVVEDNLDFTKIIGIVLDNIGVKQAYFASNYEEGQKAVEQFEPDICLLDIQLGNGKPTGIQLAEHIRSLPIQVPIIYLTSNYTDDYYHQARHTHPSAFLNKDFSPFKLKMAIDIALTYHLAEKQGTGPTVTPHTPPVISHQNLFFKIGDSYKSIAIKDINYFFADNKLTFARIDQRNYPTNVQLKTLEEELASTFIRIHKTYLVNFASIESIHPKEDSLTIKGETLPIGYAYRKAFFENLTLLK